MFKLSKIENARMNVPEPEYLPVTASEAVSEGEALVLSNGALTKCGATATPTYIAMGSVAADAEDELTQNFVAAYKEAYGGIPNQFAADAYDAVYAIKAAAEDAGITPDMSVSDICEGLKVSMTNITIDGLTGAGMTWNEAGEPNKEPKAVMIQNGAYTAM